jgi:hypothetical protein
MALEDMLEPEVEEMEAPEGGIFEEASEGEMGTFDTPTEALAAALEEHGTDAAALMDWFGQYGYDLVEAEGGAEEEMDYEEDMDEGLGEGLDEEAPEEEGGPTMGFDIVAMRKRAAKNAMAEV